MPTCYDCGSPIAGQHTLNCALCNNAERVLWSIPRTQWYADPTWTYTAIWVRGPFQTEATKRTLDGVRSYILAVAREGEEPAYESLVLVISGTGRLETCQLSPKQAREWAKTGLVTAQQ